MENVSIAFHSQSSLNCNYRGTIIGADGDSPILGLLHFHLCIMCSFTLLARKSDKSFN